ncbi:methyltransferase domain-containing protein [Lamprobacter modestohalophilus]|uniref:class I SAM-dependent methyltransferase n=1 Tax=Lamprobacter modestohalophilus TaxID=1064514 RepID=UPI002ADEAD59|nr:methyltransferase domain-containing protein [Lamprobacter modestohalophilus]MEA1052135.1 methyltransferase domain-containing protein [Lamprobacter modestohalophilus]
MQYQTFPNAQGSSATLKKLMALRLPSLAEKRFLDVGCNEGFFCGYALFDGAAESIGIDRSAEAIALAKTRFPNAHFICSSWDSLPESEFDLILLASALHYAHDQADLIRRLVQKLTINGTLVLEIGISPSPKEEWVAVKRSIDERLFPSRAMLSKILKDYAWKIVGYSVEQSGDPVPRYVVHIKKLRPYVFLLIGQPGSGKTTLRRIIFNNNKKLPTVSGDAVFSQIYHGKIEVASTLYSLVKEHFSTTEIARLTNTILNQGLAHELFSAWHKIGGKSHFLIDAYLPEHFAPDLETYFSDNGYIPVTLNWNMEISMSPPPKAKSRAEEYYEYLKKKRATVHSMHMSISALRTKKKLKQKLRYHLDAPTPGQLVIAENNVTLSGWVVPNDFSRSKTLKCYIKSKAGKTLYPVDRPRHDVSASLGLVNNNNSITRVGFKFILPGSLFKYRIEFGFVLDEKEIPVLVLSGHALPSPWLLRILHSFY